MTADLYARDYARIRYRVLLVDLAAGVAFLAVFQWSGASSMLTRWWSARADTAGAVSAPLLIAGYLAAFGAAYYTAMLPLRFYGSFLLEHRFGLSRMTLKAWAVRELKRIGVSAVLSGIALEALYALFRHAPSSWPLWATAGWVGLSVVMARIFPTVLLPIFYKTAPLQNEALVNRLLALCRRAGLETLGVFRFNLGAETRKANAALAGLGKTRRVLLADTLIEQFPPEEIEGVLAHELAHHRYRHITKLLVLSAVGSWVAFALTDLAARRWMPLLGLQGLADIAGFPLLMLWLSMLGFIGLPLQNRLSRHFEWEADRFAVGMSTAPGAFAGALRRLAQLNLADPDPPRWITWLFYDHPPITERIRAAEKRVQ